MMRGVGGKMPEDEEEVVSCCLALLSVCPLSENSFVVNCFFFKEMLGRLRAGDGCL